MVASTVDDFTVTPQAERPPTHNRLSGIGRFLLMDSPYILMLVMALGGIGYRGFVGHPILGYWVVLMPVFALLCIVGGVRHTQSTREVVDLVWMQLLQWTAFLLSMYVLTLKPVQGALDDNAVALLQLMILALGTFVAGVNTRSWRICLVGFVLLVAVPVVSWVDMSSTLIVMSLVTLVIVVALFWTIERRIARRIAR